MSSYDINSSGRPVAASLAKFIPLSAGDREQHSFDSTTVPNTICNACSRLLREISDFVQEVGTWSGSREYTSKHAVIPSDVQASAVRNCHLCTLLLWTYGSQWNLPQDNLFFREETSHPVYSIPHFIRFEIILDHGHDEEISPSKWSVPQFLGLEAFSGSGPGWVQWERGHSFPIWYFNGRRPLSDSMQYIRDKTAPPTEIFTASKNCLDFGKKLLQNCLDYHPECVTPASQWTPTRLVKIDGPSKARLVHRNDLDCIVPYYTLSYCWGKDRVLTTTLSNLAQFTNLLPFHDLPYTLQDAMRVTFEFGGRYLWIDALCIVQDDAEEWQREAATMCDVYRHSVLTIAALGAASASEGLFAKRDPLIMADLVHHIDGGSRFIVEGVQGEAFGSGVLHTRGWVFQEMVLSTRKLFFSTTLFWECKSHFEPELKLKSLLGRRGVGDSPPMGLSQSGPDPSRGYLNVETFLLSWYIMLEDYSSRRLTNTHDRLPAIQGIVVNLERKTGCTNIWGLWWDHIALELLWHMVGVDGKPEVIDNSPSWSWAHSTEPISRMSIRRYKPLEGVSINLDASDTKILAIEGYIFKLCRETNVEGGGYTWVVQDLPEQSVLTALPDFPDDEAMEEEDLYFLPLVLGDPQGGSEILCYGLELKKCPRSENVFERVGVFCVAFKFEEGTDWSWWHRGIPREPSWPEEQRQKILLI